MRRLVIGSSALSFIAVLFMVSTSGAKLYRVTDLGSIRGGNTDPAAINNKGVVVGANFDVNNQYSHAFVWKKGVMTDLGTLGGNESNAYDINDSGIIVGSADAVNGTYGFAVYGSGTMMQLNGLGGATGINKSGVICGVSSNNTPAILGGGGVQILSTTTGSAAAINDSGWVTGLLDVPYALPPYYTEHCFEYRDGAITDLGTLMGAYNAFGTDINDSGLIVGAGDLLAGSYVFEHACEWRNGSIVDISVPTGPQNSFAMNENNRGDIVGTGWNSVGGYSYFPYYYFADGGTSFQILDDPGWKITYLNDINDSGQIVGGGILNGVEHGLLFDPVHIVLQLADFIGDSVKNDSVTIYRVQNDPPEYTSIPIGRFKTDSTGRVQVPDDSLSIGDRFKVEMNMKTVKAAKHKAILGTQYSTTLDDIKFDSVGAIVFDTVTGDSVQPDTLDHTTLAYDLVVSVQWDADPYYLYYQQIGFERFSDYLYDVSDGQIRLDTVQIYINGSHWNDADLRVYATNMQWPQTYPFAINKVDTFLYLPRMWWGNQDDDRNLGFAYGTPNVSADIDYRTRCHEFGHYALGFYDEYLFADSSGKNYLQKGRCTDPLATDYGFMDSQYSISPSPYNSEMSSSFVYADALCRNSEQYRRRGMSCWDYLRSWAEYFDVGQQVFVPILRPDDRALPAGANYLAGPNDSTLTGSIFDLDYDVGALVQFPISDPVTTAKTLTVFITDSTSGLALAKSHVKLKANSWLLDEGQTADNGGIRLLGYQPSDTVLTSGSYRIVNKARAVNYPEGWVSGMISPGNVSTVSWNLPEVTGSFPMICSAQGDSASTTFTLSSAAMFSSAPSLVWNPDTGSVQANAFTVVGVGYSADISGELGVGGSFTIHALDSASNDFFFTVPYTVAHLDSSSFGRRLFGPLGQCEVRIDSLNNQIKRLLILSSDYLPIRTGLDPAAVQGGNAYSVTSGSMTSFTGTNQIAIKYSESNLLDANSNPIESDLRLYHWNTSLSQWDLIGGVVDTANNEITGALTEMGVYAAFTNNSPTGINNDQNNTLPRDFELGQNYPNPFNPTTTIEYALPTRSHVILTIYNLLGQTVETVVDETEPAGHHLAVWDGRNAAGHLVASGVYFYKLSTDHYTASRKMLLLK